MLVLAPRCRAHPMSLLPITFTCHPGAAATCRCLGTTWTTTPTPASKSGWGGQQRTGRAAAHRTGRPSRPRHEACCWAHTDAGRACWFCFNLNRSLPGRASRITAPVQYHLFEPPIVMRAGSPTCFPAWSWSCPGTTTPPPLPPTWRPSPRSSCCCCRCATGGGDVQRPMQDIQAPTPQYHN